MLDTSVSAPSAVWTSETPSIALRMPCVMPRICAVMELLIASPAASSLAELIRWPEDSRAMDWARSVLARCVAAIARSAAPLVLMTVMVTPIP